MEWIRPSPDQRREVTLLFQGERAFRGITFGAVPFDSVVRHLDGELLWRFDGQFFPAAA